MEKRCAVGIIGEIIENQKIIMNPDIESFYVLINLRIDSESVVTDVNTPLSDMEDEVDESDKSTGFQVEHFLNV